MKKVMKTVMTLTMIIGAIASTIFALWADFDNAFEIAFCIQAYYPLIWIIICTATKSYFKEPIWVATIVTLPVFVGLVGMFLSVEFFVNFACYGVTLSLLILEYKIMRKK